MVGFLTYSHHDVATRFVPTSASGGLLRHGILRGLKPCDSRHGRVLLHTTGCEHDPIRLVVWNPISGDQLELPEPPARLPYVWSAAVLCAAAASTAAGGGACDHFDCHCRPFVVVIVGTGYFRNKTRVYIYNSEAGAWSEQVAYARHSGGSIDRSVRSTLVGNTLYFLLRKFMPDYPNKNILEYNLVTRGISVVKLPKACRSKINEASFGPIEFTTMEDGRLGFVRVEDDSRLCLWSRKVGEPGWVLCKAIRLANLVPFHDDSWDWAQWRVLFGSAEGVGIIFLTFKGDLFTVDLRSGQMTKVYKHADSCLTVPYMNFCTPGTRRIHISVACLFTLEND